MAIVLTILVSVLAGSMGALYFTFKGPVTFTFTRQHLQKTIQVFLMLLLCAFLVFACAQKP